MNRSNSYDWRKKEPSKQSDQRRNKFESGDPNSIFTYIGLGQSGYFSCDTPAHFRNMYQYMRNYLSPETVVYDMTANVGGFSFQVAKYVKQVHAFEIDKNTYNYLEENKTKLIKTDRDGKRTDTTPNKAFRAERVMPHNGSMEAKDVITPAFVYCDPPWSRGGYRWSPNDKDVKIELNGTDIVTYLEGMFRDKKVVIFLKTPTNYHGVNTIQKNTCFSVEGPFPIKNETGGISFYLYRLVPNSTESIKQGGAKKKNATKKNTTKKKTPAKKKATAKSKKR